MPVSRNLSLPSSIEAGKFKKRPGGLHNLNHCMSVPSSNRNNNNGQLGNNGDFKIDLPDFANSSNNSTYTGNHFERNSSPMSRGSLSHPCLSESRKVGVTSIFSHLFLGSQNDVADQAMMEENNISYVLNVSCNCARPQHLDDEHFHRIAVRDSNRENITPYLDEAVQFIEIAREKNEHVLVHCLAGVSRSATIAIAYVMYYLRLNSDDAYRFVKDRRPTISPNFNFLGQLLEYEKKLRDNGHMTKPRIGSLPVDTHHDHNEASRELFETEYQSAEAPRNEMTGAFQKAGIVKPCIVTPSAGQNNFTPISSFCRRRNGPVLGKLSFPRKVQDPRTSQSPHSINSNAACGAGVVLDLQVSDSENRRLGSDGTEKEDSDTSNDLSPTNMASNHVNSTDTLFCHEEYSKCVPAAVNLSNTERQSSANMRISVDHDSFAGPSHVAALDVIPDVEMTDVDLGSTCLDVSPPSPVASLSHLSFSEQRNSLSPLPTTKPDRLLSRKTRSPKIVRKSWRPPYDLLASRAAKQSSYTSCQAPIPFRCQNLERYASEKSKLSLPAARQCESPSVVGLSSLSIHSPGIAIRTDPMEVVGKSCLRLPDTSQTSLAVPSDCSNSAMDRHEASNHNITNENFHLVPGTELKPKWRKRLTKTGGTEVSENTTATTSSILNHRSIAILT